MFNMLFSIVCRALDTSKYPRLHNLSIYIELVPYIGFISNECVLKKEKHQCYLKSNY